MAKKSSKPIVQSLFEGELSDVEQQTEELLQYWADLYRDGEFLRTPKRLSLVRRAIKRHGYRTVKAAIENFGYSQWHMGSNPDGIVYNDIYYIVKDDLSIEKYAGL